MNGTITNINCENGVFAALGREACGKFKGLPKGFVFTPKDFEFNANDPALNTPEKMVNYLNSFVNWSQATVGGVTTTVPPKIMPYYPSIANLEPTGGDPNMVTEGFGAATRNGVNPYTEVYTITDGGECLYKQLLRLVDKDIRMFKIDDKDVLYGTLIPPRLNDNGIPVSTEAIVRGYLVTIAVTPRENLGTQTGAILLQVTYSKSYEKERNNEVGIWLEDELLTLRELTLQNVDTVAKAFRVVTSCGSVSVTANNPNLAAEFVANPTVFTYNGANLDTGGDGVITYNSLNDYFTAANGDGTVYPRSGMGLADNMYYSTTPPIEAFKGFTGNSYPTLPLR